MDKQWLTDLAVHIRPDLETGKLYWRLPHQGRAKGGSIGCVDKNGYIKCVFDGKFFLVHVADTVYTEYWLNEK